MKKTYYTTTEYTWKIEEQDTERSSIVFVDGGQWAMFTSEVMAKRDAEWIKNHDANLAKKYGGPRVVKITLEVCE